MEIKISFSDLAEAYTFSETWLNVTLCKSLLRTTLKKKKKLFIKVLFTNPSARAGYDTRSVFKRSLTGLNSEFSFS